MEAEVLLTHAARKRAESPVWPPLLMPQIGCLDRLLGCTGRSVWPGTCRPETVWHAFWPCFCDTWPRMTFAGSWQPCLSPHSPRWLDTGHIGLTRIVPTVRLETVARSHAQLPLAVKNAFYRPRQRKLKRWPSTPNLKPHAHLVYTNNFNVRTLPKINIAP